MLFESQQILASLIVRMLLVMAFWVSAVPAVAEHPHRVPQRWNSRSFQ